MHKTSKERKEANLKKLNERIQKITLRREIKKAVKEQFIFEKKQRQQQQINEGLWDSVVDLGQMALDAVGTIPGLEAVDAANAAIHFTRALSGAGRVHYLYGLLSLISVIPLAGDVVAKPVEYMIRLGRFFGEETAIARNVGRVARFISSNEGAINSAVRRGHQYLVANRRDIEKGLHRAHTVANAVAPQRNSSIREDNESQSGTESTTQNLESETGNEIIDSIVNFILSNDTLRGIFENSTIIQGIMSAYDELISTFNNFLGTLTDISNNNEQQIAAAGTAATQPATVVKEDVLKKFNESKVERVSLKVLF